MSVETRGMIAEGKTAFQNKITEIKGHSKDIKKKLLISAVLGGTIVTANWVGIPTFALKESAWVYGHLHEAWDKGLVLGLTYGVHAAAYIFNLVQEGRVLKNPRIELSPNFGATLAYHGLEKINVLKEKRGKRSIAAVLAPAITSFSWSIPRESAFISLALLSDDNMHKLFVLKSGQALLLLLQVGWAEIALRTIGREKKKTQSLPASAVIVDMKQNS